MASGAQIGVVEVMPDTTSEPSPVLRPPTLADAPAILAILQAAFPRWPAFEVGVSPLEHLEWKLAGPGGDAIGAHAVVAIGDRVVGVRLRWLGRAWVGGNEYPARSGADVAVDPAWQGRGVGRVITAERDRQVAEADDVWIQTPSRSPQLLHMNDVPDHILRELGVWARPLTVRGLLGAQLRARSLRGLVSGARRMVGDSDASEGVRIEQLEGFDARTDALWDSIRPSFDVIRDRSAAYLNWRYADPRAGESVILGVRDRDQLLGFGVFKRSGSTARVMDLLFHRSHTSVGAALLAAGAREMRRAGARSLVGWMPVGHHAEAALEGAGLRRGGTQTLDLRKREQMPAAAATIIEAPDCLMHVTMGDFDFF